MLNRPKFMSPSTNLQECVVNFNNYDVPFLCIIDGNEAISAWQIKIYTLCDNALILDTGKQILEEPFFPIDNKNRNVIFPVNLYDYNPKSDAEASFYPAKSIYDENKTYYNSHNIYDAYTYTNDDAWASDYTSLFYLGRVKNNPSPYYWEIYFWSEGDKEKEFPTIQSCEEVFYAHSQPAGFIYFGTEEIDSGGNLVINYERLTNDIILNTNKCYFKATYIHLQGIGLKRYGWRIKDIDTGREIIDTITQNQIYGTEGNISCFCDGLLDGCNYSVELFLEDQHNGIQLKDSVKFSVQYKTSFLSNDIKTLPLNKESAIAIDWTKSKIFGGKKVGDVKFKEQYPIVNYNTDIPSCSVEIGKNSSVIFDSGANSNLDLSEDCYIVLSTQLPNSNQTTIFTAEGHDEDGYEMIRNLSFDGSKFVYGIITSKGIIKTIESELSYSPNKYKWYVITMSPCLGDNGENTWLRIVESNVVNSLYPSSTIYPSDTRCPSFGVWDKLKEDDN